MPLNEKTLEQRAIDANGWRWLPGMLSTTGGEKWRHITPGAPAIDSLPALEDRETLDLMLDLVREAWGHDWYHVEKHPSFYLMDIVYQSKAIFADTEGEVLIRALEYSGQAKK